MDFDSNSIKIAVYNGTIGFQYGTNEVNYTFPTNGVYNVTFGADWNSIVGTPTKLSELPSNRIFLKEITNAIASLSQSINVLWATGIQHGFLTGLSQAISGAWSAATKWVASIGLSQSFSGVWSGMVRWTIGVGLSQSVVATWSLASRWAAQASLSQTINSVWVTSVGKALIIFLTQAIDFHEPKSVSDSFADSSKIAGTWQTQVSGGNATLGS